ncbi:MULTISPECIES: DUF6328 family protein [Frankia]|uniref:Integral membrane protein n=1 Tax=Frankia alni (strain DSM 45986 / CECT 9034 / ACN14a) TaxID=326424 RepID=Q0RQ16_FRAAA|nr:MULTISPECIES: DUF6328 family protein [Frankia]CAJ60361.1 conserved hypothetical protein; putative membrane protein [Frankia alni ACN14a]
MTEDRAGEDDGGAAQARNETAAERADRNWSELLQELRVAQTGVQLLTAFLLSLPFQQRFAALEHEQRWLYLAVVALSVGATGVLVMPVSIHRAVFRHREKEALVRVASRVAQAGLALLALAVAGAIALIFDVVEGRVAGVTAGTATFTLLVILWAIVPAAVRLRGRRDVGR